MGLAEVYVNRLYAHDPAHPVQRWWVTPDILVGGSICDLTDWCHIRDHFGIRSVINVETEHSDVGKGVECLCECPVPDDGTPFPKDVVRHVVSFAKIRIGIGPIYVHCQMGGSRSPAFAYAILRWVKGMSPEEALKTVVDGKDWNMKVQDGRLIGGSGAPYGGHWYHKAFLQSVEDALKP
jgi:hypothetical protein